MASSAEGGARGARGRLAGRVALVTGAARGIGQGIAAMFAAQGADILAVDLPSEDGAEAGRLAETVAAVEAHGRACVPLYCDVADQEALEAAMDRGVEALGRLDVCVANAAYAMAPTRLVDLDAAGEREWRRVFDVTLFGAIHTARLAARRMPTGADAGRVLLVGSVMSDFGWSGRTAYQASKAALRSFCMSFAREMAEARIAVNMIQPGWISTPGERKMVSGESEEESDRQLREAAKTVPFGRLGLPDDVAEAAVFLCTAPYITGASLVVDGGYLVGRGLPDEFSSRAM